MRCTYRASSNISVARFHSLARPQLFRKIREGGREGGVDKRVKESESSVLRRGKGCKLIAARFWNDEGRGHEAEMSVCPL